MISSLLDLDITGVGCDLLRAHDGTKYVAWAGAAIYTNNRHET